MTITTTNITTHPMAWVMWLASVIITLFTTRNPLYLILILLITLIVFTQLYKHSQTTAHDKMLIVSPVGFALFVMCFTTLFNSMTTHYGKTTLFTIPGAVPILSGNVTLEGIVYGFTNSLIIAALFTAFSVLNVALPVRAIIRFIPRTFYPLAIIISIAVTFVPTTVQQFHRIREAQLVRGHRMRHMRDWVPLLLPLLVGGLERALQVAEAMTARGFASSIYEHTPHYDTTVRYVLSGGLLLLLMGWMMRLVWGCDVLGTAAMALGIVIVLGVLWHSGQRTPHTTYRNDTWRTYDTIIVVGSVIVLLTLLTLLPGINRAVFYYTPYPQCSLPPFQPMVGLLLLGMLLPALPGIVDPFSR